VQVQFLAPNLIHTLQSMHSCPTQHTHTCNTHMHTKTHTHLHIHTGHIYLYTHLHTQHTHIHTHLHTQHTHIHTHLHAQHTHTHTCTHRWVNEQVGGTREYGVRFLCGDQQHNDVATLFLSSTHHTIVRLFSMGRLNAVSPELARFKYIYLRCTYTYGV
jgi:hypothetical protein